MGINLNFEGVQKAGGTLPPGDYEVTISEFKTKPSKSGDSLYSAVTYVVDSPEEFNGRKIWDNVSWHENALPFARNFVEAVMGTEDLGEVDIEDEQMAGETLGVTIVDDEYNGRKQSKVIGYFPV